MSPKRAYIFWFFLFVSFPLGVGVLAYASGYRIDRASRSIIHTSALSISTSPSHASITIDGQRIEDTTPYIGTLEPGTYTIDISKPGYHSWTTDVSLSTTESALLEHIVLFPKSTPLLISKRGPAALGPQPIDAEYFASLKLSGFSKSTDVVILKGPVDLVIDPLKKVYALIQPTTAKVLLQRSGDVVGADWNNNNTLLIATPNEIFTFTENNNALELVTRQSTSIISAVWHPKDYHILFSDSVGLYAIESFSLDHDIRTELLLQTGITELSINTKTQELEFALGSSLFSLIIE